MYVKLAASAIHASILRKSLMVIFGGSVDLRTEFIEPIVWVK
jgi:hypothetical protein